MEKISKVKSVQGAGTWDSPSHGTFYKFEYEMEDGTVLTAMHKSENSFNVGDEVEYKVTKDHPEYGKTGKVSKPQQKYSGGKQSGSTASFALSYAKDLAIAHINQGNEFKTDEILKVAGVFNNWLKQN